jgi:hypothetical protein
MAVDMKSIIFCCTVLAGRLDGVTSQKVLLLGSVEFTWVIKEWSGIIWLRLL